MDLTVSMATFDDYDGVFFTIQALRMYQALPAGTELLVIDNHPDSAHGRRLAQFAAGIPEMRVVPVTDRVSSWVKYDAFAHARGEILLGLDCHVLLQPGFIAELMAYWRAHPHARDMLTGPLLYDNLRSTSVKMEPRWRGHDYGTWGDDQAAMREGIPFAVPMQGMGCFSVRRDGMFPVHPGFRGFGGEEWYCAEKVRANGGRVVCHPAMAWNHRFSWPARTFPVSLEDKVANYYRGWLELYGRLDHWRIEEMTAHWETVLPPAKVEKIAAKAAAAVPVHRPI